EIYGDGSQVRDYVNAADVVSAVRLALLGDRWAGPVVIGTGTSLSVVDVLEEVRRVTGADFSFRHGPAKAGEMPAVIVDPTRAKNAGWTPRYDFTKGITSVWEEWSGADVEGPVAAR